MNNSLKSDVYRLTNDVTSYLDVLLFFMPREDELTFLQCIEKIQKKTAFIFSKSFMIL